MSNVHIHNPNVAGKVAHALRTRLVEFVMIAGNSNWARSSAGFAAGFGRGLRDAGIYQYGCAWCPGYSTNSSGTMGMSNSTSWFTGMQAKNSSGTVAWRGFSLADTVGAFFDSTALLDAAADMPEVAAFHPMLVDATGALDNRRAVYRSGAPSLTGRQLEFPSGGAPSGTNSMTVNSALTADFYYGNFNNGTALTFSWGIYLENTGSGVGYHFGSVSLNNNYSGMNLLTAPAKMTRATVQTVAATRTGQGWVGWAPTNGTAWSGTGSVYLGDISVFETGRTTGFRLHSWMSQGGRSDADYAYAHRLSVKPKAIRHFMEMACRPHVVAGQDPFLVVMMEDLLNFRNATIELWDSGDPDGATNHVHAVSLMMGQWKAAWDSLGYPAENLVFCHLAEFPTWASFAAGAFDGGAAGTSGDLGQDDAEHIVYRDTAHAAIAADNPRNFFSFRTHNIMSRNTLMQGSGGSVAQSANSYYDSSGTDAAHLTANGYIALGAAMVPVLMSQPRRLDFRMVPRGRR